MALFSDGLAKCCADCSAAILAPKKLCTDCMVTRRRARARAYYGTPAGARAVLLSRYKWVVRNRDKQRGYIRAHYWRNVPLLAAKAHARWEASKLVRARSVSVVADYSAISALVPRGIAGREDVIQDIALAILEGRATFEALRADRRLLSQFCSRHTLANFEGRGYAISLNVPRFDGRPWDDVLAGDNASPEH